MELDDFKNTWDEIGNELKQKQKINLNMFDKMSQQKMHVNLRKIILPEILGSVICFASAVYIAFNFGRLDTLTYQLIGATTMVLLILLSLLSVMSMRHLYKAGDVGKTYAETVKEFAVQKIKFCKLQKLNLTLSYLLLVMIILLMTRLFGRNTITDSKYFFVFAFTFGYCFLLFFSKWIYKSYNKTIRKTEDLLKELL
jgi:hypothetical protein